MACDITSGRIKACKNKLGGLGKLYLFNFVENPFTYANGIATAVNPTLLNVFEYALEGDGNNIAESLVSDRNTGTSVNTQTTTIVLKGIDATTSAQMNLLAYGFPMAVVKDRNGVLHAVGIDDGIDFTVAQTSGGGKAELNGYTLTGVSTTGSLSPKLDTATAAAFLALVAPSISGPSSVVVGSSIVLVGSGTPATSGTWVSGTTAKATVSASTSNTVYVTGVAAGTSIITYKDINGLTATKTITVTA